MAEHSKTPWKLNIHDDGSYVIKDALGESIAYDDRYDPLPFDIADAKAAVRAVNSHGALVAALEAVKPELGFEYGFDIAALTKQIDDALALAKGEA